MIEPTNQPKPNERLSAIVCADLLGDASSDWGPLVTPEEDARLTHQMKYGPCFECGAATLEEAERKCKCAGDKDSCHGCDIWPDA